MRPSGVVTLLTDFGTADMYVGALKGSLLAMCPGAHIVDITHDVEPFNIRAGAFIGSSTWPYFPRGTIHVVIVDPGVGTERAALVLETPDAWFMAPDNGLLSPALPERLRPAGRPAVVNLPSGFRAYALVASAYQRPAVSATFHGRDVFAPAAGHLLNGVPPQRFGPGLAEILALPPERAAADDRGVLSGSVIYVDRFGNLVTNIRREDLPYEPRIKVGDTLIEEGIVLTYGCIHAVAALINSAGHLEIAAPGGRAADLLGAGSGERVRVTPGR